jgi:hypothetical protein
MILGIPAAGAVSCSGDLLTLLLGNQFSPVLFLVVMNFIL